MDPGFDSRWALQPSIQMGDLPGWWNGRHAALRTQWPSWPCGFNSRLRHQHFFSGYSSSGRAPGFQPEGGRFEPDYPHQDSRDRSEEPWSRVGG